MANEFRVKNGIITGGNILPDSDGLRNIGASGTEFQDGWFDGTVNCDDLTVSGTSTTIGTVTSGSWQGTRISPTYGGTGLYDANAGTIVIADGTGAPTTLDVGSSTAITILGTVGTGVWQGTAVASAYLDSDTMHLSVAQTITGEKTIDSTDKFYFRDSAIYLHSDADGYLEAVADTGISLKIGSTEQIILTDGVFKPTADGDVDLGTTGLRWKDAYVDSITVTGEVDAATLDISGTTVTDGTIYIKEGANAAGDTVAYGQLWVKTATPNQLYFTTDAGDDVQITSGTGVNVSVGDNSIDADALYVGGDGTSSQFLRSDGDGSFSWAIPSGEGADELGELSDATSGPTNQYNLGLGTNAADALLTYVGGIQDGA